MSVPLAVCAIAFGVTVAPSIGRRLFAVTPGAYTFLPSLATAGPMPEPAQHAQYLLSLLAPAALAISLLLWRIPRRPLPSLALTVAIVLSQMAFLALAGIGIASQGSVFTRFGFPGRVYFPNWALPVGIGLAVVTVVAVASGRLRDLRPHPAVRSARARWLLGAFALAVVAAWLLPDVFRTDNIASANFNVQYNLLFSGDDILAVADGRSPLVNFIGQYTSLWPYLLSPVLSIFGYSIGALTILLSIGTLAAFWCLYLVLARLTRHAVAAFVPFVCIVAVSLVPSWIAGDQRISVGSDFAILPLRYLGPCLLAWLCCRHLDGAAPRRTWPLFALGTLAAINDASFGLPALGAAATALLVARIGGRRPRQWGRLLVDLAAEAAVGIVLAVAAVCILTLIRAGALPHWGYVTYYARTYALAGLGQLPMPEFGFQIVVYLTFVAALIAGTVGCLTATGRRTPAAMLVFSAVFGLGAGAYYANRPHPDVLVAIFPAWGLSLALLAIAIVPAALAAAPQARARLVLPLGALVVGFVLTASTVIWFPDPGPQISRISIDVGPPSLVRAHSVAFVRTHTHPGEPVLLMEGLPHLAAARAHVVNVLPFNDSVSIVLASQLRLTLRMLHEAGGTRLFAVTSIPQSQTPTTTEDFDALSPAFVKILRTDGWRPVVTDPISKLTEWSQVRR